MLVVMIHIIPSLICLIKWLKIIMGIRKMLNMWVTWTMKISTLLLSQRLKLSLSNQQELELDVILQISRLDLLLLKSKEKKSKPRLLKLLLHSKVTLLENITLLHLWQTRKENIWLMITSYLKRETDSLKLSALTETGPMQEAFSIITKNPS